MKKDVYTETPVKRGEKRRIWSVKNTGASTGRGNFVIIIL